MARGLRSGVLASDDVVPLDDRGRINQLRRPVELLERDDPDGLTGHQRAGGGADEERAT